MNCWRGPWQLGAYALTASLAEFSRQDAVQFYAALHAMPSLRGLELPVHSETKADDPWRHLDLLPRDWDYVLTPLPAIMQNLSRNRCFGLASLDDSGQKAALALLDEVRRRIPLLNEHCGRQAVRVVHLHSAPSLSERPTAASREALRGAFTELAKWDWYGAELRLEHCDSAQANYPIAKGFLPLAMELPLLQEFAWGLSLNWGRSVLEAHDPEAILQHIQTAKSAGILRSLFFSGVAVNDSRYGNWLDNHVPLALGSDSSWESTGSLLTVPRVIASLQAMQPSLPELGIKIQPAPASLQLSERLAFIQAQLEVFDKVWQEIAKN